MSRSSQALYVAGRGDSTHPIGGLYRYVYARRSWSGSQLAAVRQLSSLARHPQLPVLYGTSGVGDEGRLHAWRMGSDDSATLADTDSSGAEPCFVCVHPAGHLLIVTNYTSGTLASWQLNDSGVPVGEPELHILVGDGSNAEPDRQDRPHPHQAVVRHDRLLVADLGADVIRTFPIYEGRRIGEEIEAHPVPAGTGPRHAAVAADGTIAVSGELAQTVVFPFRDGCPTIPSTRRTSIARTRPPRNYPGDIQIAPGPSLGYLANRGHDTIAVFTIHDEPQLIAEVDAGVRWPQHLLVTHNELVVAGWDSSEVVSLPLDENGIPGEAELSFTCPGAAWLISGEI